MYMAIDIPSSISMGLYYNFSKGTGPDKYTGRIRRRHQFAIPVTIIYMYTCHFQ